MAREIEVLQQMLSAHKTAYMFRPVQLVFLLANQSTHWPTRSGE
jgi:hypothetical protein